MSEKKLFFNRTCFACPEQYNVYSDSQNTKQVAYVRLRLGYLTVSIPDVNGEVIYKKAFAPSANRARTINFKGAFKNERERKNYLGIIEKKILRRLRKNG